MRHGMTHDETRHDTRSHDLQVIQGWDVGVMKMSLGEKAILKITSDLGYGDAGAGGVIPPNADLVFEVVYCLSFHITRTLSHFTSPVS